MLATGTSWQRQIAAIQLRCRRYVGQVLCAAVVLYFKSAIGAENVQPFTHATIHVQEKSFSSVASSDIAAVLDSAAEQLLQHCPEAQLSEIVVYHRADYPQFSWTVKGRTAIGLTAESSHWAQYSFQFAHELCHALANRRPDRWRLSVRSPNANLWLEESLCETASLFTLLEMSRKWQVAPPYPAWRDYAHWLNDYAQQRLNMREHRLPEGKSFIDWFRENEQALRYSATQREKNTIIAAHLLPLFEAEPHGWETLLYLNDDLDEASASLQQHMTNWRSRSPQNLQPFVTRAAQLFGIE